MSQFVYKTEFQANNLRPGELEPRWMASIEVYTTAHEAAAVGHEKVYWGLSQSYRVIKYRLVEVTGAENHSVG